MTSDLSNIRTLQDVINVLSIIYFNMNEIERIYYDMFLNPIPMDVTFQRYDDQGVLENITLPNRAKDAQSTLSGAGSPEGVVAAGIGVFYLDTTNQDLYYKGVGTDAYGWLKVYSSLNLEPGASFLAPNGDGSQLTNLNMTNAGSGVLAVGRGGTGSSNISGLVKGNGTSAYSAAIDGTDYMGPASMTGVICYYPVANIPAGWLLCDGKAYSRTAYAKLFNVIGTTYGVGDGSTTFNVPNLMDYFVRCWDGNREFNEVQEDQAGAHTHPLTGTTGEESEHTHTRGNMEITGSVRTLGANLTDVSGAFEASETAVNRDDVLDHSGYRLLSFKASNSWTGKTSGGSAHSHPLAGDTGVNGTEGAETRVRNKALVPIIKY